MRYVYLYELDSVRKSDAQVIEGQKALFDEIVCNGNCVVLSFNQLTDSRAVLSMLHSERQTSILLQLFQHGYVKYSRFGSYRTPSAYIQKSIEENRSFIYSSLPMKSNQYYLQEEIFDALRYADVSRLVDLIEKQKESTRAISVFDEYREDRFIPSALSKEKAIATLEYLKRYVELIITISLCSEYALPASAYTDAYPSISFEYFMNRILSFDSSYAGFSETKELLKEIKQELISKKKNINSRSEWILCLFDRKDSHLKEWLSMAECVIHLCYNYTVEYSMYNVSKHYEIASLFQTESEADSFQKDFFTRLRYEREKGTDEGQLAEESNQFQWFDARKTGLDWNLAVRMIQKKQENGNEGEKTELYENDYLKRRDYQKKQNYHKIGKILAASLLSLFPIIVYTWIENTASDLSNQLIAQVFSNEVLKVILVFIAANLMTVILERIATVSNLWEIGKECKRAWKDFVHLSAVQTASYVNWSEIDHLRFERKQKKGEQPKGRSDHLVKYCQLWRTRPSSFQANAQLPLVDPVKEYSILEQYEHSHHMALGLVHASPYYLHIVDLVRNDQEQFYPYERLLPTVEQGAVVVIALYQGQYVVLKQFRHALRDVQFCFVRGFGETGLSEEENVRKEIMEEIGGVLAHAPIYLGKVSGDSGILATKASVYAVELESYGIGEAAEGIEKVMLYAEEELIQMIQRKEIDDGFTLAAYMLYRVSKS